MVFVCGKWVKGHFIVQCGERLVVGQSVGALMYGHHDWGDGKVSSGSEIAGSDALPVGEGEEAIIKNVFRSKGGNSFAEGE